MVPRYAHKWRYLGELLNFAEYELEIIFSDFGGNNSEECCSRLLFKWLEKHPDATWDQLFVVIDKLPEFSHKGL